MAFKLIVSNGKQKGQVITVREQIVIGRDKRCHLRPNSALISRLHCKIYQEDGQVKIEDLGSRTGTHVNDVAVTEATPIDDGAELKIGPLEFELKVVEAAAAAEGKSEVEFPAQVPQSSGDDDLMDWLADDAPSMDRNSSSTLTEMEAVTGTSDTVTELKALSDSEEEQKPNDEKKSDESGVKDTREAAADILERMIVRQRNV